MQSTTNTTFLPIAPDQPVFILRFLQDPLANTIAVIVLFIMITSVIITAYLFLKIPLKTPPSFPPWLIPALAICGLFIAGYLSYVELSQSNAICGPVGDCNAVQRSPYARLWGILPIGVIGVAGYFVIIGLWLFYYFGPKSRKGFIVQILWGTVLLGTLFSSYLTFLEPFVIGATCAWCVTTALVMTFLLWLTIALVIREDQTNIQPIT